VPVIGIGEAAFHLASMLGRRFSVVTTLSRSIAATRKQSVEVRTGPSLRQGASMELLVLSLDDLALLARASANA
jgi:allantoin racemase